MTIIKDDIAAAREWLWDKSDWKNGAAASHAAYAAHVIGEQDAKTKRLYEDGKSLRRIFGALPPGPRCRDCADAVVGGYEGRCINNPTVFCDPVDEIVRMLQKYAEWRERLAKLAYITEKQSLTPEEKLDDIRAWVETFK